MILIALGSNMSGPWGTPRDTLLRALKEMPHHNIRVRMVSDFLVTAPFGVTNQPDFVNAVARVETVLPPETLMQALHMIERKAGRKRLRRWGPRTLDLDLIDYHGLVRRTSRSSIKPLTLPHPGVSERAFVLSPLLQVAPQWRHPASRVSAAFMFRKISRLNGS